MDWDLIGHAWAVRLLQQHLASREVRHAYLFTGAEHIGKRTLALRLAQALNCQNAAQPGERCGECRACRQTASETFPDLHVVERQEEASQVKIEQVRDLQHQLALSPLEGTWRIALLADFDEATEETQNAILKTLEEPAARVVLLLTARSTENLFPTVVSRCEVLSLRPPAPRTIEDGLLARGADPQQARLVSALSQGRPGAALEMLRDASILEARAAEINDLLQVAGMSRAERFAYAESLAGRQRKDVDLETRRREALGVLETWLSVWRDVMLLSYGTTPALGNPDREEEVASLASTLGPSKAVAGLRALEQSVDGIRRNANLQLALEELMLDLPTLPGKQEAARRGRPS
jgi:DNA polymerase-3 subunit delta'